MRRFPLIRDLVTDVSRNYEVNKRIQPFTPKPREADGTYRMQQYDIDRLQEFHKCIECFLCQDVCHVLRTMGATTLPDRASWCALLPWRCIRSIRPIAWVSSDAFGIGLCNITKCCTEVCPEDIHITDNAIIPLKERGWRLLRPHRLGLAVRGASKLASARAD